jgi:hypothetical protein
MRVRIPIAPQQVDISDFRVFISYKFDDAEWADSIHRNLSRWGFRVDLVPPTGLPARSFDAGGLEERLTDLVNEADAVCILVSSKSVRSDWVRYECKIAAQRIGRVILLIRSNECAEPGLLVDQIALRSSDFPNLRRLKHTTVANDGDCRELAHQIVNDPDENWFDGNESHIPSTAERNLKRESRMRRQARIWVGSDSRYRDEDVREVLPFFWDEIRVPVGETTDAFRWHVTARGRLDLDAQVRRNEVDVFGSSYPVIDSDRLGVDKDALMGVLVIVESRPDRLPLSGLLPTEQRTVIGTFPWELRRERRVEVENALEIDPLNADKWAERAFILLMTNRVDEALVSAEASIRCNPKSAPGWAAKCAVLSHRGEHGEALDCVDRAMSLDPNKTDLWNVKGTILIEMGELEQADRCFDEALTRFQREDHRHA